MGTDPITSRLSYSKCTKPNLMSSRPEKRKKRKRGLIFE